MPAALLQRLTSSGQMTVRIPDDSMLIILAPRVGLEPTTCGLTGVAFD